MVIDDRVWRAATFFLTFLIGHALLLVEFQKPQEPMVYLGAYPLDDPASRREGYILDDVWTYGPSYLESLLRSQGILPLGDSNLGEMYLTVRRSQARQAMTLIEKAEKEGRVFFRRVISGKELVMQERQAEQEPFYWYESPVSLSSKEVLRRIQQPRPSAPQPSPFQYTVIPDSGGQPRP
jgi:hypothetical protein